MIFIFYFYCFFCTHLTHTVNRAFFHFRNMSEKYIFPHREKKENKIRNYFKDIPNTKNFHKENHQSFSFTKHKIRTHSYFPVSPANNKK